MRISVWFASLALVAAVPGAALSASAITSTAAPGGAFNSCAVVTQAEAATAIGEHVSTGVLGHATVEGGLACVFYGPSAPSPHDPDVAQVDTVRVVVVKGADALKWYESYRSTVTAQPIAGYGAEAFYDGCCSLSVFKGDYYLRDAVVPPTGPSLKDDEILAKAILPKL